MGVAPNEPPADERIGEQPHDVEDVIAAFGARDPDVLDEFEVGAHVASPTRQRRNWGTAAPSTRTPPTHARPPSTTEAIGVSRTATMPDSKSPRRGPPVTTRMWMPGSRPRRSSGTESLSIDPRNTAETTPPPPATARNSSASHNAPVASPNPAMQTPQIPTAISVASPCRRTRPTHPAVKAPSTPPSAI